jgi:hypothetical protein
VRLVEQNALAALSLSDYAYVIGLGRTTLSGPERELLADTRAFRTPASVTASGAESVSSRAASGGTGGGPGSSMPAVDDSHRSTSHTCRCTVRIRYLLVFVGAAVAAMTPGVADATVSDRVTRYVPRPAPTDDPARHEGPHDQCAWLRGAALPVPRDGAARQGPVSELSRHRPRAVRFTHIALCDQPVILGSIDQGDERGANGRAMVCGDR